MTEHDTSMLAYPTDRLVGIADDPEVVRASVHALREAGANDEVVEVLCCDDDAARFAPDTDEVGALGSIVRTVQRVLGDESEKLDRLDAALEAGHAVIVVDLAASEEAAREAEKRRLAGVLVDAGATEVSYYGPWAIEDLDLTV